MKNWYKKAQTDIETGINDISKLPETQIITETNPLDGKTNSSARKIVFNLINKYTRGLFKDIYWKPVQDIWEELNAKNINWVLSSADYKHDDHGNPISKEWKFEVNFTNNTHKPTILHGIVTAYGAGTVEDPLSRYDLTASIF